MTAATATTADHGATPSAGAAGACSDAGDAHPTYVANGTVHTDTGCVFAGTGPRDAATGDEPACMCAPTVDAGDPLNVYLSTFPIPQWRHVTAFERRAALDDMPRLADAAAALRAQLDAATPARDTVADWLLHISWGRLSTPGANARQARAQLDALIDTVTVADGSRASIHGLRFSHYENTYLSSRHDGVADDTARAAAFTETLAHATGVQFDDALRVVTFYDTVHRRFCDQVTDTVTADVTAPTTSCLWATTGAALTFDQMLTSSDVRLIEGEVLHRFSTIRPWGPGAVAVVPGAVAAALRRPHTGQQWNDRPETATGSRKAFTELGEWPAGRDPSDAVNITTLAWELSTNDSTRSRDAAGAYATALDILNHPA